MTVSARFLHTTDRAPGDDGGALDTRTLTLRAVMPYCLAILATAPSIIHFAVARQHFQEYWLLGVVTLVAGWLQLLWAVAIAIQPSRRLWWWVGAVLTSGMIVVDLVTRPVMGAGGAGFGTTAATVFEALVVLGCAWLLFANRDLAIGREALAGTFGAVGLITAAIVSISLLAGGPGTVKAVSARAPDRHGLQADVPLPGNVAFAGVHQAKQVPDMQYHSNISVDTWGWTVSGTRAVAVEKFYASRLPKQGWTNVRWEAAMGGYGNANHLTACQSGQVLLISTSAKKLEALDTTTGRVTASVTAPRAGAALLIQIDRSPQAALVACPGSRTS